MPEIAVLIPCYNESQTIGKVVKDFQSELPEAKIYVFDNNSTDGTDEIAKAAGAVVKYEYRQGKGNVIRTMFRTIHADCYILVDGDDTYPAKHAREMSHLILEKNSDMVIGDRLSSTYFTENKRPFHNSGNIFVKNLVNLFFQAKISDIFTGYRAFSRLFVKTFPVLSKGFEIETEMTIHALDKNLQIDSVLVDYRDRPIGSVSKLNTLIDGSRVIGMFFSMLKNYRPLLLFGSLSIIMALISIGMFVPVFIDYELTGLVAKFPTLIVSGFVMIGSIQLFSVGLLLNVQAKKNRQDFELHMNSIEIP